MRLKVRQLEIFHALAEEGAVSKVAQRLNLTQPAVSTAITKLEQMVGFALFTRRDGAFVLTPEARLLHAESEQALVAAERVEVLAEQLRTGERGVIRVSAYGAASVILLPAVIADFSASRPGVNVVLQVRDSAQVQKFVGDGQADIGVIEGVGAASRVRARAFNLNCVCIMRGDDPLTALDSVTPENLVGRQLVGVADNHGIDRQVARAFATAGVDLSMPIKGYFFAAIRNLVRNGAGVAVIDAVNGAIDVGDGIVWKPFRPAVTYEMSVIAAATTDRPGPARDFHDMLVARLEKFEAG